MSDSGEDGLSVALDSDIQRQLDVHSYMMISAFTLLLYDYLLTVDREVTRYWGDTRITWWTFLFYVNRYGAFFGAVPAMVQFTWISESPIKATICPSLQTYHNIFVIVAQIVFGVILTMRTYALYDRSRFVLTALLCVSIGVLAFSTWSFVVGAKAPEDAGESFPRVGCGIRQSTASARILGRTWLGILGFDSLIVFFTAWKAFVSRGRRGRLLSILIRDSVVYFLVLAILHTANITSLLHSDRHLAGVVTTLSTLLTSVMTSRFMLNLRDPKLASPTTTARATMMHALTTVDSYYGTAQAQSQADQTEDYDSGPPHSAIPLVSLHRPP